MSQETAEKISLIILCIVIAIGSVIGLLTGILYLAFTGENGWLALIIGSVLLFIGAVYGIFKLSFSKRAPKAEREKKSSRNTLLWVVVAFVSGAGAILSYFFGMKSSDNFWLFLTIVVFLVALCLYSIFVLISGGRQKEEKITNIISPTDEETNKRIEETIKKIEQND